MGGKTARLTSTKEKCMSGLFQFRVKTNGEMDEHNIIQHVKNFNIFDCLICVLVC